MNFFLSQGEGAQTGKFCLGFGKAGGEWKGVGREEESIRELKASSS